MNKKEKSFNWMFIIYPALAMMLGWGLRGHIGGGPFGAMIPGAMVASNHALFLSFYNDSYCCTSGGIFQQKRRNYKESFLIADLVIHPNLIITLSNKSRRLRTDKSFCL